MELTAPIITVLAIVWVVSTALGALIVAFPSRKD